MLLVLALTRLMQQAQAVPVPRLELVTVVATAAPGAEIVSVQASTRRAALTHSQSGRVEIFDLTDPAEPRSLRVVDLALGKGEELTSVALPPSGDWFLAAVKAKHALEPGRALAVALGEGKPLATFPCGVGPDCVTIAPSGRQALIANEAEGFALVDGKLVSAPGSLTRIEFAAELADSKVTQIAFPEGVDGATDGRLLERQVDRDGSKAAREIPLANTPDFLEPEVVVFLPGEERALVTLQESDTVALVHLESQRIERFFALGMTAHPADLHDDGYFEERAVLTARREPDGIAMTPDGRLFVTADEGDTKPSVDRTAVDRPTAGGRTLSVFDCATGKLLGDTGPQLDRAAAVADCYPDRRSLERGSEPEMVVCFALESVPYAAVTLERAGAVALVDLGDPTKPTVVALAKSGRSFWKDEPEGLALFRDPVTKRDYLYVANEGSGTLGVLRVAR